MQRPIVPWTVTALGRNTLWMLLGNGSRLLVQALYFVLMARYLGPRQYGSFAAVTAVAAIASPFVGNGYNNLMIKHVARDRLQYAKSFGTLITMTFLSGVLLSALVIPLCLLVLSKSISPVAITIIAVADLLMFPFVEVAGVAFWSLEQLGWTAAISFLSTFTRLTGIVVVLMLHRPTLIAWSVAYLLATAFSSVASLGCVLRWVGAPRFELRKIHHELWEGFHFSVALSAQSIYNDIDKTMLARLGTLGAVGIYAAAYRLIDVAFVPVKSLLTAAYPRFFRAGKNGIHSSMQFGVGLLKRTVPYSLCVSVALLICAPLVPLVLGHEYAQATEALRWLAVLPLFKTIHYFIADSLTGAGYQGLRTLVQLSVAAFNILINLWLIPVYTWRGAAWSSIASDGLLAVLLWTLARGLAHAKQSHVTAAASPANDQAVPALE